MKHVQIVSGKLMMQAELYDTPSGRAIFDALPLEGRISTWGDEIYFTIPLSLSEEDDAGVHVAVGDVAYWPVGHAFCIFFGPTPVSIDEHPHAASPVNVFGKVLGDATRLKGAFPGAPIHVSALENIQST